MSHHFGNTPKSPHKHGSHGHAPRREVRPQVFTKTFRWSLPAGQAEVPEKVEVAATFTLWQKYEMVRDVSGSWNLTFEGIPGNQTHHYMFFADGKPVEDKNCDGLAKPNGAEEEQFALETTRGPRVFMLFAQTK
ncbi:MAG TPA: glycogen-binding domain-containing protein [Verrucomicrobiae bacterium]|jgi:hypothetical protein